MKSIGTMEVMKAFAMAIFSLLWTGLFFGMYNMSENFELSAICSLLIFVIEIIMVVGCLMTKES